MTNLTIDPTFQTLSLDQLDGIAGGFSFDRMVDNGNRYGGAGALLGGGVGLVAGGVVAGAPTAGVAALPGAALGAGIGTAIGGTAGWVGGAAVDAVNQLRGK